MGIVGIKDISITRPLSFYGDTLANSRTMSFKKLTSIISRERSAGSIRPIHLTRLIFT